MASPAQTRRSELSLPRQNLLQVMQRLNFGRIEQLAIRDGEPVLEPAPRLVRTVKFSANADNGPNPSVVKGDFCLRHQIELLSELLDSVGNGLIEVIDVKHGLPLLAELVEPVL